MVCIEKRPYTLYGRLAALHFRYLTCLLDRGHIITKGCFCLSGGVFFPAGRPVGMMCPADEASLTPRLRSRATVVPQQGYDTAIYWVRPQFLLVCSHNPVKQ